MRLCWNKQRSVNRDYNNITSMSKDSKQSNNRVAAQQSMIRQFDNTAISRSENRSDIKDCLGIGEGHSVEIMETVINTDTS